jgi:hypothetical protein
MFHFCSYNVDFFSRTCLDYQIPWCQRRHPKQRPLPKCKAKIRHTKVTQKQQMSTFELKNKGQKHRTIGCIPFKSFSRNYVLSTIFNTLYNTLDGNTSIKFDFFDIVKHFTKS